MPVSASCHLESVARRRRVVVDERALAAVLKMNPALGRGRPLHEVKRALEQGEPIAFSCVPAGRFASGGRR